MKACFKCGLLKPLEAFYKHAKMADGHLNKCIECAKRDSSSYRRSKILDPQWLKSERVRCVNKSKREAIADGYRSRNEAVKVWYSRNPAALEAHTQTERAVKLGLLKSPGICQECGNPHPKLHKHHEDYSRPLEVIWLCPSCHGKKQRTLGV